MTIDYSDSQDESLAKAYGPLSAEGRRQVRAMMVAFDISAYEAELHLRAGTQPKKKPCKSLDQLVKDGKIKRGSTLE